MKKDSDTRERILDAAEHLFAERGFAGTSLRRNDETVDPVKGFEPSK